MRKANACIHKLHASPTTQDLTLQKFRKKKERKKKYTLYHDRAYDNIKSSQV